MIKLKTFLERTLVVLCVLMLTGCWLDDNPVRTSLEIDGADLVLSVGESATRVASSRARNYQFIYTSSNPSVATVNQNGKVTALSVGEAVITVNMPETSDGFYGAAVRQYRVIVKEVSAAALKNLDQATPLTLVAVEDGKITVAFNGGITLTDDIHYTINGGEEQSISKNTQGSYDIVVHKGDVVQLYSNNDALSGGSAAPSRSRTRAIDEGAKYINIRPSMKTEIYGNVMSLLKGKDNLESADAINAKGAFYGLFAGAEELVNSAERQLVLPATTLSEGCYQDMFNGCKGIEKAPELPAPTLIKDCYSGMFNDCAKLSHVKCLATDVTAEGCTDDWLTGAGKDSPTPPVIETAPGADWSAAPGAIPENFEQTIAVNKITLSPTDLKLKAGETATLKAAIEPENATDKALQWSSDRQGVAAVSSDGVVTAVAAGTATITVSTTDGSVSATCKVTVEAEPVAQEISYHKVWVYGQDPNREPPFTVFQFDGNAMRFSYSEGQHFRTLADEEYFGHKKLIVEVSNVVEGTKMRIMDSWWSSIFQDEISVSDGQIEVQVTDAIAQTCAKGGAGKDLILILTSGSCTVNAVYYMEEGEEKDIPIRSLTLPETLVCYNSASVYTLSSSFVIYPYNASNRYVNWESDNPSLVAVDSRGILSIPEGVTGMAHIKVSATDGSGKTATCTVMVKNRPTLTYEVGTLQKTPGSTFTNPLTHVGDGVISYKSSDTRIATVDSNTGAVTIAANAKVGDSVQIIATGVDATDGMYHYTADVQAEYTVTIIAPTAQGEREGYTPGTW